MDKTVKTVNKLVKELSSVHPKPTHAGTDSQSVPTNGDHTSQVQSSATQQQREGVTTRLMTKENQKLPKNEKIEEEGSDQSTRNESFTFTEEEKWKKAAEEAEFRTSTDIRMSRIESVLLELLEAKKLENRPSSQEQHEGHGLYTESASEHFRPNLKNNINDACVNAVNVRELFMLNRDNFAEIDDSDLLKSLYNLLAEAQASGLTEEGTMKAINLKFSPCIKNGFRAAVKRGEFDSDVCGFISYIQSFSATLPSLLNLKLNPRHCRPAFELAALTDQAIEGISGPGIENLKKFLMMIQTPFWVQSQLRERFHKPYNKFAQTIEQLRKSGENRQFNENYRNYDNKVMFERRSKQHQLNDREKNVSTSSSNNRRLCYAHRVYGDAAYRKNCNTDCDRFIEYSNPIQQKNDTGDGPRN